MLKNYSKILLNFLPCLYIEESTNFDFLLQNSISTWLYSKIKGFRVSANIFLFISLPRVSLAKLAFRNEIYASSVMTNYKGEYRLVLKNGTYELSAIKEGYVDYHQSGVRVKLGQINRADITME